MRIAAIASAGVLMVAVHGSLAGTSRSAAPLACSTSGLVVWVSSGGVAAGTFYYKLEFTNLSGHACSLFGYPGVSAVNLRGRQLGRAAGRDSTSAPRRVVLRRGRTATAVLEIADVLNYTRSACRAVTAAGLRVYPPNQTRAKLVPLPFRACSRGPVYLHVRVVR